MSKAYINITKWPNGIGLDLEDPDGGGSFVLGGSHGGGVGKTLYKIPVDLGTLEDAIRHWKRMALEGDCEQE